MTHNDSIAHTHSQTPVSHSRRLLRLVAPLGVLLMMALTTAACSMGVGDIDAFVIKRDYRLDDGDHHAGDQVVFAYKAALKPESVIDGDLTVAGNNVMLDATVRGDVTVVADRLEIGETALIAGNLVVCVNTLERHENAGITGDIREECGSDNSIGVADIVEAGWNNWRDSAFFRLSTVLGGALFFGALAALATVIIRRPLVRMSESVRERPLLTIGMGLITMLVVVGLTLLYALSLKLVVPVLLLPVVLLVWLALLLLSVAGWLALAEPFGIFLLRLLRLDAQPHMIAAAVGGITLALLLRLWSVFWFDGWVILLAMLLFGAVGLGPMLLTRFGTRAAAQMPFFHNAQKG